ncbi:serine hydrolase-domain-containing protein [Aspergillus undulatus]|uniref:serine hydrolase-domain-containing protein n=1 Tax=Aspergillus undulatus TaxID=1810928 RepID=UPI003CCD9387
MRILCLHGHTQTGPVFERKTYRLQQHIKKAFPGASFYFPTGAIAYKVSDRLDYLDEIQRERSDNFKDPDDIDTHAWFRLHQEEPPIGLLDSIDHVAEILRDKGPFDGIICFSQGSVVGAMVASLLEGPRRRQRFEEYSATNPEAVRFPDAYKDLNHPPFKFGITYGAYMGRSHVFSAFYNPLIETPFMHFMGEFDPVVPSDMAAAVDAAQIGGARRRKMMHPGAHAIPIGNEYHEAVVDFIQSVTGDSYFGLPSDSVPSLGYHDTPELTPLQTPVMTPALSSAVSTTSLPSSESTILGGQRLDKWRKPKSPRRMIKPRLNRGRSFLSSRRSTSSSSMSSQHSDVTQTRAPSPAPSCEKADAVVTVVEDDMMAPEYETEDWQELMLSDLLNEMLRRQGRPGKFYFVPDGGDAESLVNELSLD